MFLSAAEFCRRLSGVAKPLVAAMLFLFLFAGGHALAEEVRKKPPAEKSVSADVSVRVVLHSLRGDALDVLFDFEGRLVLATPLVGLGCKKHKRFCRHLNEGKIEEAANWLAGAMKESPAEGELLLAAAGLGVLQEDFSAACEKLHSARPLLDGSDPRPVALEALLLLAQRRLDRAESHFLSLSKTRGFEAFGRCGLGHVRMLDGLAQSAAQHYFAALKLKPRSVAYRFDHSIALWLSGKSKRGAECLAETVALSPRFGDGYLMLGLARLASGQATLAAAALLRAEELGAKNPLLYPALGTACRAAGFEELASRYLQKALAGHPEDEQLRDQLVVSLMRSGQSQQAARVLIDSKVLSGNNANEHFLLGLKLLLCDQPQAASQVLFRAVSLGKRDADTFFALGQALLLSDLPQPASLSLRVAIQFAPQRPETHFVLALSLSQQNRIPEALAAVQEALRLSPEDTNSQQLKMDLLRKSGQARQCAALGRQLVDREPDLLEVRFSLALCLAESGQLDQAFEHMQDALDRDQEGRLTGRILRQLARLAQKQAAVAGWHLMLAQIYQHRGDWNEAVQSLERFILVAPSQAWGGRALEWLHRLMSSR